MNLPSASDSYTIHVPAGASRFSARSSLQLPTGSTAQFVAFWEACQVIKKSQLRGAKGLVVGVGCRI
jgi:hypothetical protein